jgi:hypothetical protein
LILRVNIKVAVFPVGPAVQVKRYNNAKQNNAGDNGISYWMHNAVFLCDFDQVMAIMNG